MIGRMKTAWILSMVGFQVALPSVSASEQGVAGMGPTSMPQQQKELFTAELATADQAGDPDSKVEHLRKALSYRPDDPDNIALEFRIGIELSQRSYPKDLQGPRMAEALTVFEHIMTTYKHMDYYSQNPANETWSTQFMVPKSAILAACIHHGLNHDTQKSREHVVQAMQQLNETYKKRVADCGKAPAQPKEPESNPMLDGPWEESKRKSRAAFREKRRAAAASGDVFGVLEMGTVESAVRQYGYTYGRQKPAEVPAVMEEIVKMFPGSPMAKVAQEHAQRALAMTEKEVDGKVSPALPQNLMPAATRPAEDVTTETQKPSFRPAPASAPASAPATRPAEDAGSVVQGHIVLDAPISLHSIHNYHVLPYEITFKKEKGDILASVKFYVRLPPNEAKQKSYRTRLFLLDDEGKLLAEQTAEVSDKVLTVIESRDGYATWWTITGQTEFSFAGIEVFAVRRFELRLMAY